MVDMKKPKLKALAQEKDKNRGLNFCVHFTATLCARRKITQNNKHSWTEAKSFNDVMPEHPIQREY